MPLILMNFYLSTASPNAKGNAIQERANENARSGTSPATRSGGEQRILPARRFRMSGRLIRFAPASGGVRSRSRFDLVGQHV